MRNGESIGMKKDEPPKRGLIFILLSFQRNLVKCLLATEKPALLSIDINGLEIWV